MSERTPLLSGSVNGPSTTSLPSRRDVQNSMPSKNQRIKAAQALGAVQAGKLPSQAQLSKILSLIAESDTLKSAGGPQSRTARLGPEGQKVLENVKAVMNATKQWGEVKNGDDLLQNFLYNAVTANVDVDANTASPPSQKEMSRDAQRTIESLRRIASLMITNPAFRQLGSDVILLTRDIFADAASAAADQAKQAAESSRPSEKERKDGVDFDGMKKQGKATAKGLRTGKVQGEARENIWDEVEKAKQYFDEKLPEGEEARDKVIQRLQQQNPDYRRSVTAIVNMFKKYTHKAQDALEETKDKSDVNDEDEKVQQAGRDLKAFVEKVSNKSLDDVIKAAQKNDKKLSVYFNDLESFIDRLLYQPGYVMSNSAYKKASSLYDDGQSLIAENPAWKADAAELQRQLEGVINGIANDEPSIKLISSLENLGDSLATAGQIGMGSLKVDGHGLYRDFMDVILPRVIGLVREIPVPRVEFKSEDVDLVIDDIRLESASFIPDSIRFVQHNDLRFTQGYATCEQVWKAALMTDASEYDATIRLRIDGLHFQASNIAFWVSKKTGFLPFEDAGVLDIQFGPDGIMVDVTLENADEDDQETFFTVKSVEATISGFDYQISNNSKWFATWFAKPFLRAFIQRNLTSAIEAQIAEYLRVADFRLYGLQQRAIAATNAKPTAANFVNAIVKDTIFPQSSGGAVKTTSTGVTKYGRRGEFVLHIGVDEELFPNKPPPHVSNKQREKMKAKASAASRQATGAGGQVQRDAQKAADKGKKEVNELDAKMKEQQRRESRSEGWRSEAFDV